MKKVFYTAIAILGLANLTIAQVPSYVPSQNLKGWWGFNGNANDATVNGNNGTVNGAALSLDRSGMSNSAYLFNGTNNYIGLPLATGNISNSNQFTISYWINPITINGTKTIFSHWITGGSNENTPAGFYTNISDTSIFTNYIVGFGVGSYKKIIPNSWYNVVIIYDGTQSVNTNRQKLYINGLLQNLDFQCLYCSSNIPPNIGSIASYTSIGARLINNNWTEFFNGSIDDIGIWNRALTQLEVTALYRGCSDTIITQPSNISGNKGSNKTFSFIHSGTGNSYQWQSNSVALGWQNVPNSNQYMGTTTNSLTVNGLSVSNHNQLFRVITSKSGCLDTSNIVTLIVSDIATDSLRLLDLVADSMDNIITVTNLKTDTTNKGNTIRQLQTDLANKHDTLYVGSNITTDTLKISIRTGIVNTSLVINSLKVYPNPAATLLNIELEKPGYYIAKLSSVIGQTLVTPTSGSIDISNLSNGVYLLTIYDSNNKLISTNKVLIVK